MKAAICYEFGKPLVVEDIDMAPPGEGEVKIRLAATAICHSDVHDIKGELPGPVPFVGGHESAGYIDETGAGAVRQARHQFGSSARKRSADRTIVDGAAMAEGKK